MRYRFGQFELDTAQFSLRAGGLDIHVEPLVYDLLRFFVERAGQVLTRDAIIAGVWKGRFVSDATVSSCIKSARKALGDSGQSQTYIRTVRGRGFQFAGCVEIIAIEPACPAKSPQQPLGGQEVPCGDLNPPKIAVLPFFPLSPDPQLGLLGDALAQEVILELSRLHWLFVIARGSSFQFRGQEADLERASHILGAGYFLTGTIQRQGRQCIVALELCRAPDSNVIWADVFTTPAADIMHMRPAIAGQIAAALEPRIQLCEVMRASKVATEHLNAWAAYHRGLWHMFRFNRRDNELAAHCFAHAIEKDPAFARAHAGLSFTHFQNAFLGFSPDGAGERQKNRTHALKGLELDPLDPFVNLSVGRAEWLAGDLEASLPWMERSISLSPNYAFAIYNSALVGTLMGEGESNEKRLAKAIALSPIDPLNYAMLCARGLTHLIRGHHEEATGWMERAIRAPNAHVQIYAFAAVANEFSGNSRRARDLADHVRQSNPGYSKLDFLRAFPLREAAARKQIEQSLQRLGF